MLSPHEAPLSPEEFVERLRREGSKRYHDEHPFHVRMHEGKLGRADLQAWVENRYYYQTRIPIKDALIVAKSDDPAFRRAWIRRIHDHDGQVSGPAGPPRADGQVSGPAGPPRADGQVSGQGDDPGGLAQWLALAEAVGLDRAAVASCRNVLPGVRFACDAYVSLVRESPLVVAVASSLTEAFAPDLMSKRIAAWEEHYRWVDGKALGYFRSRVPRARRDSEEAIDFVQKHAKTRDLQEACVAALIKKTEILWHLLDCVASRADAGPRAEG